MNRLLVVQQCPKDKWKQDWTVVLTPFTPSHFFIFNNIRPDTCFSCVSEAPTLTDFKHHRFLSFQEQSNWNYEAAFHLFQTFHSQTNRLIIKGIDDENNRWLFSCDGMKQPFWCFQPDKRMEDMLQLMIFCSGKKNLNLTNPNPRAMEVWGHTLSGWRPDRLFILASSSPHCDDFENALIA